MSRKIVKFDIDFDMANGRIRYALIRHSLSNKLKSTVVYLMAIRKDYWQCDTSRLQSLREFFFTIEIRNPTKNLRTSFLHGKPILPVSKANAFLSRIRIHWKSLNRAHDSLRISVSCIPKTYSFDEQISYGCVFFPRVFFSLSFSVVKEDVSAWVILMRLLWRNSIHHRFP